MTNEKTLNNYNKVFIGMNLKKLRQKYKLKITEVAKVLDKTRGAYDHYERGIREISVTDLIILSGFYNVSLDVLVANPFATKSDHTLSFLGFEKIGNEAKPVAPITISTIYDDVICYKEDDYHYKFFWKTNANNEGKEMLFHYYEKLYVSKIYYNGKGGGHFYIDGSPRYFNKAHAENIVMRGVLMGELNKHILVEEFFE